MNFFLIFSNCILTKGKGRSLISDLQNQRLYFLPNELYAILIDLKTQPLERVKNQLGSDSQDVLMEYINYFIEENIGFYCDEPKAFPDLNLQYSSPEIINNAIIDIDKISTYNTVAVINQLIELRCKFLQVRAYSHLTVSKIEQITNACCEGYFRNVDFIVKYPKNDNDFNLLKQLMLDLPIIGKIIFHSSPKKENNEFFEFTEKMIIDNTYCGIIKQDYFSPAIKMFSESQHYNTCLNQKVAIDVNGDIKNCPSMSQSFGNIENTTLKDSLQHNDFKKNWSIIKDQITSCKDCEFRYICTDCRAYVEDPDDNYSKPLKCGYDPNTNEWSEWSKNPLKQAAIKHYGMGEFVKNDPA